ncbi:hypothetical protein SCUP234_04424 [Seiridium cupressi]
MPPAVKRQRPAVKSRLAPPKQQTPSYISSFVRVSKSVGSGHVKKDITSASAPITDAKLAAITPSARKRKAVAAIQEDSDSSADEAPTRLSAPTTRQSRDREILPAKRGRGRASKKSRPAPASLKRGRSPSVSDSDQSTINTDKLFKRLRLESSPSRASSPLTADTSLANSEAGSDIENPSVSTLPDELISIVNLHASLLKTLTLHYAHNGSNVPADLRVLCPNVARAWGKKAVSLSDIKICLGVLNMQTAKPLFTLSDYGRMKTCIEIDSSESSGPLDERELNDIFRSNLEELWSQFIADGPESCVTSFVKSLPKSSITTCDSVAKASPIAAKGQQRLAELKQGMAAKKLEKDTKLSTTSASAESPLTNPDGSKMSLLDRLRFKQMQKASMPAGLSPAEMARRAALQRVEEVAALIGMLSRASSAGMGRTSFPMSVMLQKLKDSFRMGISTEEGATCVRLIASEVAPEWVVVVTINGKENVVVETDRELSKAEVARRVQAIAATF